MKEIVVNGYYESILARTQLTELVIYLLGRFNLGFAKSLVAGYIQTLPDKTIVEIRDKIKEVINRG